MLMIELKDITKEIIFDEVSHTYTRASDGKTLNGVTTMLRDMGLSADYNNIDQDILMKAADRGKMIHALCDLADAKDREITDFDELEVFHDLKEKGIIVLLDEPTGMTEANTYLTLRREEKLIPITSEYLVSDGENIASSVDLVFTTEELMKDKKVLLSDIKCTSSVHEEPLGWQLSTYKYLFERQNPTLQVAGLLGVWLPKPQYGTAKIFDAKMYAQADIENLIFCYANGIEFHQNVPSVKVDTSLAPTKGFAQVLRAMDELKKREENMKLQILQYMAQNGMKKLSQDGVDITYRNGVITSRFDSTAFKKDHPDLYNQYKREVLQKESIMVKIQKQ